MKTDDPAKTPADLNSARSGMPNVLSSLQSSELDKAFKATGEKEINDFMEILCQVLKVVSV